MQSERVCTFADLQAGERFIFKNSRYRLGEYLVAVQILLFVGGEREEKFAVNTFNGTVINNIPDNEVVARMKKI